MEGKGENSQRKSFSFSFVFFTISRFLSFLCSSSLFSFILCIHLPVFPVVLGFAFKSILPFVFSPGFWLSPREKKGSLNKKG